MSGGVRWQAQRKGGVKGPRDGATPAGRRRRKQGAEGSRSLSGALDFGPQTQGRAAPAYL
jgi:hypothetical protein